MAPGAALVLQSVPHAQIVADGGGFADLDENARPVVLRRVRALDQAIAVIDVEPEARAVIPHRHASPDCELPGERHLDAARLPAFGEPFHIVPFERAMLHAILDAMTRHPHLPVDSAHQAPRNVALAAQPRAHPIGPFRDAIFHHVIGTANIQRSLLGPVARVDKTQTADCDVAGCDVHQDRPHAGLDPVLRRRATTRQPDQERLRLHWVGIKRSGTHLVHLKHLLQQRAVHDDLLGAADEPMLVVIGVRGAAIGPWRVPPYRFLRKPHPLTGRNQIRAGEDDLFARRGRDHRGLPRRAPALDLYALPVSAGVDEDGVAGHCLVDCRLDRAQWQSKSARVGIASLARLRDMVCRGLGGSEKQQQSHQGAHRIPRDSLVCQKVLHFPLCESRPLHCSSPWRL